MIVLSNATEGWYDENPIGFSQDNCDYFSLGGGQFLLNMDL